MYLEIHPVKRVAPWWNQFPFVRLIFPLGLGIYFQPSIAFIPTVVLGMACIALSYLFRLLPVYLQFRYKPVRGILINILLFSLGILASYSHDLRNDASWFARHGPDQLLVRIISDPKPGKNGYQADGGVIGTRTSLHWIPATGKIKLRFQGGSKPLFPGSILLLKKQPTAVMNKPGASFDYRAYLANQNIHHQVNLKTAEFSVIHAQTTGEGAIFFLRNNILALLDREFKDRDNRALAKALLVGERSELESSLINAYTQTGVIHVIAISGLHLGLIYGMLLIIFKPFIAQRKTKLLANLCIATALWVFTLICGASASVVRSAVMFSSLLLADSLNSDNHTGNALASSAFILLCWDPFLLKDIGFQLSYAAVASLLIYNNAVAKIFRPENNILVHAWSSISTSISAQIMTTPLILYHFHQFPLVFILSNLVAVPVSGLILFLLILLCLLQAFPGVTLIIASASSWLIVFMNDQVSRLARLPFAVWGNIQWTSFDLIFSYLSILVLTMYARTRSPKSLLFFLLTILTWSVTGKYSLL